MCLLCGVPDRFEGVTSLRPQAYIKVEVDAGACSPEWKVAGRFVSRRIVSTLESVSVSSRVLRQLVTVVASRAKLCESLNGSSGI